MTTGPGGPSLSARLQRSSLRWLTSTGRRFCRRAERSACHCREGASRGRAAVAGIGVPQMMLAVALPFTRPVSSIAPLDGRPPHVEDLRAWPGTGVSPTRYWAFSRALGTGHRVIPEGGVCTSAAALLRLIVGFGCWVLLLRIPQADCRNGAAALVRAALHWITTGWTLDGELTPEWRPPVDSGR